MANIYLQVQSYVAAYYRNRDDSNVLGVNDPVKFCSFSQEQFVLQSSLVPLSAQLQAHSRCYSAGVWNTMLTGKSPITGNLLVKRDRHDWLTYSEVCTMMSTRYLPQKDNCDYLCIAIPDTVMIGNTQHRTTALFALDHTASFQLQRLLHDEFVRALLTWYQSDLEFCAEKGISRSRIEMLERFMLHYDIPVGPSKIERDSLRRLLNRWLSQSLSPSFARVSVNNTDITRLNGKEELT